jgi:hypothetical protein
MKHSWLLSQILKTADDGEVLSHRLLPNELFFRLLTRYDNSRPTEVVKAVVVIIM